MNGSTRKLTRVLGLTSFFAVAIASACDSRPTTTTSATPAACPECVCNCTSPEGGTTPPPEQRNTNNGDHREEIDELAFTIGRKATKKDPSCLADFDRLTKLAPSTVKRMAFVHGQCMMIAGKCEAGSSILRKEMSETTELMAEQLDRTIETYASMYCSGPLDERGELLRALGELQKGAYQGNIGIRACTNAAKTVAKLKGRVRPKNDEDHQINSLSDSFGPTAAACFARAGDCGAAWKVYNDEFAATRFNMIADVKIRQESIRQTFDSMVPKCKGRP